MKLNIEANKDTLTKEIKRQKGFPHSLEAGLKKWFFYKQSNRKL